MWRCRLWVAELQQLGIDVEICGRVVSGLIECEQFLVG
jgi:hypothetical protein